MKIEIGGKAYDLKFTINSVADLEELTGRALADVFKTGEFSAVRAIAWAGLSEGIQGLTIRAAGTLVDQYLNEGNTLEDLFRILNEATEQSGFLRAQAKGKKAKA